MDNAVITQISMNKENYQFNIKRKTYPKALSWRLKG